MNPITITENAAIKRINRKLAREGLRMRTSRSANERSNLGLRYVVNDGNVVESYKIDSIDDLTRYARECGVLTKHETIQG